MGTKNTAGNSGAVLHTKFSQWSAMGNKFGYLYIQEILVMIKIIICLRSFVFESSTNLALAKFFVRWDQKNDTWMLSEILRTLIVNIDYRVSIIAKKKNYYGQCGMWSIPNEIFHRDLTITSNFVK